MRIASPSGKSVESVTYVLLFLASLPRKPTFPLSSCLQNHVRPFVFAGVPTTSDTEQVCDDLAWLNTISVIKIEFRLIKKAPKDPNAKKKKGKKAKKTAPATPPSSDDNDPLATPDERKVNEVSEKGKFGINPGCVFSCFSSSL